MRNKLHIKDGAKLPEIKLNFNLNFRVSRKEIYRWDWSVRRKIETIYKTVCCLARQKLLFCRLLKCERMNLHGETCSIGSLVIKITGGVCIIVAARILMRRHCFSSVSIWSTELWILDVWSLLNVFFSPLRFNFFLQSAFL